MTTTFFNSVCRLSVTLILLCVPFSVWASAEGIAAESEEDTAHLAHVVIDGRELFEVRGVSAFPAKRRARQIQDRIIAAARDASFDADDVRIVETANRSSLYAGDQLLFSLFDADADSEGIKRDILIAILRENVVTAIRNYREDRGSQVLIKRAGLAVFATAVGGLILWLGLKLFNWLGGWAERHVARNLKALADKSHQLIHAGQVWGLVGALLRGIRLLFILLLAYFYLNTVLGLFPWTRSIALVLFNLILDPLTSLWQGFVASLPGLAFLVILFFIVRYVLRVTRLFFRGVANGRISITDFDPDWALPTYKIIRVFIIAFAVVVAYPYIPGSDSLAFKGVSLFLGVIVSLGSSSFVSNLMAGLAMTYRGAFKEGDRVKIGDVIGRVEEIKMMITRVRTPKNESVVIPNSNILTTNVVNYSVMARDEGMVLHTTVGIGYDVPWRQVEAMLKLAAGRTEGLKTEPQPYVLQSSLGDYAVNYELNVFCDDQADILQSYSDLHANIQDVFNEHEVQIMSPAYEADPETAKIVAPDDWYAAPAVKPGARQP